MVDDIMQLPERTKFMVLAPVIRGRKGEHVKLLEKAAKSGFVRAIIDGSMYELSEEIKLDKNKKHIIDIVYHLIHALFADHFSTFRTVWDSCSCI